jgi:multidrug efflux pump
LNSLAASGHSSASAGAAVATASETMVPLSAVATFSRGQTPLGVNHQGLFAASTISFNLAPGHALSEAQKEIADAVATIRMPSTVRGVFAGTAATFQQSQATLPLLFGAACSPSISCSAFSTRATSIPLTIISTCRRPASAR